jgi:hypothetical protein
MWSFTLVLELDYIEVAIITAHEMRLRSTAHSSNVLDCLYSHG